MSKYIVRKRKWPFSPPLKRSWELLRDGKPVGFYQTEAEAVTVKELCEAAVAAGKTPDA